MTTYEETVAGDIVEELRAMNSRTVSYCLELGESAAREIELLRDQVEGLKKQPPMADDSILEWLFDNDLLATRERWIGPSQVADHLMPAGMRERLVELELVNP